MRSVSAFGFALLVLVISGCGMSRDLPTLDAGPRPDAVALDGGGPIDEDAGPIGDDGGPPIDAGIDSGPEPCPSPGAMETVPCGSCGTVDRFCTSGGTWAYGTCEGEGECAPGAERTGTCGMCGTAREICSDACAWEPSGACEDEGECMPGARTRSDVGCPAGQTREVVCGDACAFEPAGMCEADACPTPGATETVACGMCGTRDRFCTSAGVWTYGLCGGEGVCAPGTTMPVPCGRCGTRMARCTTACAYDGSGTCTGEGVCTPGETSRTTMGCPAGQSRLLTCEDTCDFATGPCEVMTCTPGATEMVACGMCGMRTRTCTSAGAWMDGPCTGEGTCMPGTTGSQACGLCGTQTTRCNTACAMEPSGACTGEITCGPPPAPMCLDATRLRTSSGPATCGPGRTCAYTQTDVTCTGGCSAGMCAGPVMLLRGLGGTAGFGTGVVPSSDDGSSAALSLTATFPSGLRYYGTTYNTVYLNNNGNVSFGAMLSTYTPAFPGATVPIIAPWWGDVDTRGAGQPARNNVVSHFDAVGGGRLVATWHLVGYYAMHDTLQNSFQLIITNRSDVAPGDFDVELRYEQCQWTTGDASGGTGGLGGTPASAGFDGAGMGSLALPGSGTSSVLSLCTTSNVGTPGLWRYRVRGGIPMP